MRYPGRNHRSVTDCQKEDGDSHPEGHFSGDYASPTYRDFAQTSRSSILQIIDPPKPKRRGPRGGVTTPFPKRLFDMLQASHKQDFQDIVAWQSHGRSFIVRNPTLFEARILPRFFSQSKMSSFQRQLNLYGFLRQNTGRDRGSYYHELFLRSRPDLPTVMVRTRVKGIGMGRTNRIAKDPNFYEFPFCLPEPDDMVPKSMQQITSNSSVTSSEEAHKHVSISSSTTSFSKAKGNQGQAHGSSRATAQAHPPPSLHNSWLVPIPPVTALSFSAVVTPLPGGDSGGRRTFRPFPGLPPHVASPPLQATSSVPSPEMRQGFPCSPQPIFWRTSTPLPMIPAQGHKQEQTPPEYARHHPLPALQPRYHGPSNGNEYYAPEEQADLFEGLEFQVVDDDSLEQYEVWS